ncbi:hypothetical protein IAQ61_003056 [Plenodomus lingam]|uniref:Predicted protein n=1 Tax=Leptosphaeria maculans (strain JN3 / isolate v23.1.3 / race Av1-4-5-6-7-8) TaxID=985895 RepID=E5ADF1_LEPMJ|nr:predicted protein [Plenodomus lingam JN3]KAH9875592.1 hypothetical protein IAQ61_003056 [Plenodomus lingam]CBY01240.1 predicted protein [Plenodomus lingam JN3]
MAVPTCSAPIPSWSRQRRRSQVASRKSQVVHPDRPAVQAVPGCSYPAAAPAPAATKSLVAFGWSGWKAKRRLELAVHLYRYGTVPQGP